MTARILIADDTPDMHAFYSAVLGPSGHELCFASDGEEALMQAREVNPDLLICDVVMPKLTGWEVVRHLRGRPRTALMPVIFVTSLTDNRHRLRGYDLDADGFLTKPVAPEILLAQVETSLRRAGTLRPLVAPPSGVTLAGRLSTVGLPSLLGMLELEQRTGVLRLEGPGKARVGVRGGAIVGATVTRPSGSDGTPTTWVGIEAVREILQWPDATFELEPGVFEASEEPAWSTTWLIMEAARMNDEADDTSMEDAP